MHIGAFFGFWLVTGIGALSAFCLTLASVDVFQRWLDDHRARELDGKQFVKLTAVEKAKLFNQLKARSTRPAIRLGMVQKYERKGM